MFTSWSHVTGAETNGARAMLEFLQNGRYWSIQFEVKYSSLLSKHRRVDLLLIEFVRFRESLPEYCISDSRARFDAIDHFLGTKESLLVRLSIPFSNIFSTLCWKIWTMEYKISDKILKYALRIS